MLLKNLIPSVLHKLTVDDNAKVIGIACQLKLMGLIVLSIHVRILMATRYHSHCECVVLAH